MGGTEKKGMDRMRMLPSSLPRERLLKYGEKSLSNAELLAIVLRTGGRGKNVLELGSEVLRNFDDSLVKLSRASLNELSELKGMGRVKAITLKAVFEIARRYYDELLGKNVRKIGNIEDVLSLCRDMIYMEREVLRIISLASNLVVLSVDDLTVGTPNATLADPKDILRMVIKNGAEGFVMVHNHPSGEAYPSRLDVEISKRLKRACKTLEIDFLDHVIISKNGHYSFKRDGRNLRW